MNRFPSEISGKVTVYPFYDDLDTGKQICVRCVLDGCFWNESSSTVIDKLGQQTKFNTTVYIPYSKSVTGREYVTPGEWRNLLASELDRAWTLDPLRLPLVVNGECLFEFVWAGAKAPERPAEQEIKLQKAGYKTRRITGIQEHFYGSSNMWHLVVKC